MRSVKFHFAYCSYGSGFPSYGSHLIPDMCCGESDKKIQLSIKIQWNRLLRKLAKKWDVLCWNKVNVSRGVSDFPLLVYKRYVAAKNLTDLPNPMCFMDMTENAERRLHALNRPPKFFVHTYRRLQNILKKQPFTCFWCLSSFDGTLLKNRKKEKSTFNPSIRKQSMKQHAKVNSSSLPLFPQNLPTVLSNSTGYRISLFFLKRMTPPHWASKI